MNILKNTAISPSVLFLPKQIKHYISNTDLCNKRTVHVFLQDENDQKTSQPVGDWSKNFKEQKKLGYYLARMSSSSQGYSVITSIFRKRKIYVMHGLRRIPMILKRADVTGKLGHWELNKMELGFKIVRRARSKHNGVNELSGLPANGSGYSTLEDDVPVIVTIRKSKQAFNSQKPDAAEGSHAEVKSISAYDPSTLLEFVVARRIDTSCTLVYNILAHSTSPSHLVTTKYW